MKLITLIQGTPEWHEHRARHLNASDAPAMMGCSSYTTRSELIKRLATGIVPEVDAATQRRFDDGHRSEALARPLAEDIIGEELSPCVGEKEKFSASFDGLTFMHDTAFEHKRLNARLREAMDEGCTGVDLPLEYQIQMEHQCMVGDSIERVLFMASEWTGDGAIVEERHCWYEPNGFLRAQIVAGWEQLEKDVAAYVPVADPVVQPTAKIRDALPALRIEARGEITTSNLEDFKAVVLERINEVKTELTTDQEFADADEDAKWLRDVADKMRQAVQMVRSNIQPVDAVLVVLEQLDDIATKKALQVEKLVKSEKEKRKEKIVLDAQRDLAQHIEAVNTQMGASYLQVPQGIFAPVIKSLKSLDSMQDKVRAALGQAIGEVNATALRLRTNRDHLEHADGSWMTLFPDFATVGTKAPEDFQALAALRIGQHKAAQEKQLEAARTAEPAAPSPATVAAPAVVPLRTVARVAVPAPMPAADEVPTLKIGAINERLQHFKLTADDLRALGFKPSGKQGPSPLFRESEFPAMCRAIAAHALQLAEQHEAAAVAA